ncbi:hypothetical protein T03_4765 [Trichinella britovi]|uniref:CCHC-type domain-containing protein n=1 Tax=Trichinella britovi TaxID=45882 RepID=A0A0V1CPD5_TRIBR|nr:hypothetical protein T03_4765 [Trichinella britovi]
MGKDPHAGELPLSEAVMPGLKEKFPRALQRVWYLKVGAGPESEDNLEFAQLQVNSLSPTGDPGLEDVMSSADALVTSFQRVCPFCEGDHDAPGCQRFLDADHSARTSMSREKGVCYKCLKIGHRARECRKWRQWCRPGHWGLTAPTRVSWPLEAPLLVLAPTGRTETTGPRVHGAPRALSLHDSGKSCGAGALMEESGVSAWSGWKLRSTRRKHLGEGARDPSGLWQGPASGERSDGALAGNQPEMGQRQGTPLVIDVLIGINYYYEFVTGRRTAEGLILDGPQKLGFLTKGEDPDDSTLQKIWEIESLGIVLVEDTPPDGAAALKFEEELSLDGEDIRLVSPGSLYGRTFPTTIRRPNAVSWHYSGDWTHARKIALNTPRPPRWTWYLPHHAVYQGSGDERRCRVVFDDDGTKLNSQLEAGPIKDLGKRSSCRGLMALSSIYRTMKCAEKI